MFDDEPDFELEDIAEQAELVGKLTPIEYGRLRGIAPQQIYGWIRSGVIEVERCICGRKVVDVKKTDAIVAPRRRKGIVEIKADGDT